MEKSYYINRLKRALKEKGKTDEYVTTCCKYARYLLDKGIPVLFDEKHIQKVLKLSEIKKNGYHIFNAGNQYKQRIIEAPRVSIKMRQKWILDNILEMQKMSDCIHGFVKGRSIVTNAKCHVGKRYLLCMDIENFFHSISSEKVEQLFIKIGYSSGAVKELANICTFEKSELCYFTDEEDVISIGNRYLPQGAPSSPMIANLIFNDIDVLF